MYSLYYIEVGFLYAHFLESFYHIYMLNFVIIVLNTSFPHNHMSSLIGTVASQPNDPGFAQ